jgi:hypothetical protein
VRFLFWVEHTVESKHPEKDSYLMNLVETLRLQVDWSARRETPAGSAGKVRPRKHDSAKLTLPLAESEHLERKSTISKNNKVCENSLLKTSCLST